MSYENKSDVGKFTPVRFKEPQKNSAIVSGIGEFSVPIEREQPASIPLSGDQRASLPLSGDQRASIPLSGDQRASLPLSGDQRASIPLSGDQRASLPLSGDQSASIPLLGDQRASLPLSGDQSASIPLLGDQRASLPLSGDQSASMPLEREQPASIPLSGDQRASMPLSGDQRASVPLSGDQRASIPLSGDQRASVPVSAEQKASALVGGDRPQSVAVHTQQLSGVEVFGRNRAETFALPGLTTKLFGYNSVVGEGFKIDEAVNMKISSPDNAISAGYKHARAASAVSVSSGTPANSLFTGLEQSICTLNYLALAAFKGNTSLLGKSIPRTLTFTLSNIGSALARTIPAGQSVKVMFPNATTLAPIRGYDDNKTGESYAGFYAFGPVYIPFVMIAGTGTTDSSSGDNISLATVVDDPADLLDNGICGINMNPVHYNAEIIPIPAVYTTTTRIADVQLDRYMSINSVNTPVDCMTYARGFEIAYPGNGVSANILDDLVIKLELTPVSDFICTDESGKYNGNGYVQCKIASITGYSDVSDVNIYYANTDYCLAGPLYSSGIDIEDERDDLNQTDLAWKSLSYKKYEFDIPGIDGAFYVVAAGLASTSRYFIAADLPVQPGGAQQLYLPENLSYIYDSLPAASNAIDITRAKVLKNTSNLIAVLIEYNDIDAVVIARRGSRYTGSGYLVDDNERQTWVLSQYIIENGHAIDYELKTIYTDSSDALWNETIGDEWASSYAISSPSLRKQVPGHLYIGNDLFLDEPRRCVFKRTFLYGYGSPVYVPVAADNAVYGFSDMASFGSNCVCIPFMLPSVAVTPAGVVPPPRTYDTSAAAYAWLTVLSGCNVYNQTTNWNLSSGYKRFDYGTDSYPALCGGRGTIVLINTPALATGNAYANLPPSLESIVGFDPITEGISVASEYYSGEGAAFADYNGMLYESARFPLNPDFSGLVFNATGSYSILGNYIFVSNDNNMVIYMMSKEHGLQYVTTAACASLSNIVTIAGAIVFASSDGIYAFSEQKVIRLYKFPAAISSSRMGYMAGVGVFVYTYNASSGVVSYIIDPALGVYKTSTGGTMSGTPTLFDDRHTPLITMILHDNSYAPGLWQVCKITASAATSALAIESNNAIVARGERPFVMTTMEIYFERTSSSFSPFSVALYNESSDTTAVYTNESVSAGHAGMNVVRLSTGMITARSLRYKLYDIAGDVVIHNVKLIGYYSDEVR